MPPLTVAQRRKNLQALMNIAERREKAWQEVINAASRNAARRRTTKGREYANAKWFEARRMFYAARENLNTYIKNMGFDPVTFNVKNLPTMLVHKRALLAAKKNKNEKAELLKTNKTKLAEYLNAKRELNRLVAMIYPGLKAKNLDFKNIKKGLLTNLLTKKGGNKLKHAAWRVGLEGQMKKARANFNEFSQTGRLGARQVNHIGESHRKKTPSPVRPRTPRSPVRLPNANASFRRWHQLAPATNEPATWSRNNQNAKLTRYKTLANVEKGLAPNQRLALAAMTQNEKREFLKSRARA